ncbi:hypothetical protein Cgig2_001763 [Carnegiea gigantea]|uniref:Uncharacterized protein n=1 Tax=Carnegiea gigantea TaxID=171969 RepID=A0A9Q1QEI7_9CARY|nr:hypothetical protein Cgig2_001763 [Carnegiea gigantea]
MKFKCSVGGFATKDLNERSLPQPTPSSLEVVIDIQTCSESQLNGRPHAKDAMTKPKPKHELEEEDCDEKDDFDFAGEEEGTSYSGELDVYVLNEEEIFHSDSSDEDDFERGNISTLRDIFHVVTRRIYMVHYKGNFKKLFPTPKLNFLLSRAATAYCQVRFTRFIESLFKGSPTAYIWLQDEPYKYWCRHGFDSTTKVFSIQPVTSSITFHKSRPRKVTKALSSSNEPTLLPRRSPRKLPKAASSSLPIMRSSAQKSKVEAPASSQPSRSRHQKVDNKDLKKKKKNRI